jgi:hypothetical protein
MPMRGICTTDMGQWSSGYDARKLVYKSDDSIDGILGELFPLFFTQTRNILLLGNYPSKAIFFNHYYQENNKYFAMIFLMCAM